HNIPPLTSFILLDEPVEDIDQILAQEKENSLKTWIYATGIDVDIHPQTSGQWDTIPELGFVWRIGIAADNALSLNLLIRNYHLQEGMLLHVYDSNQTSVFSFDTRNNNRDNVLSVASIPENMVIIEWNIPTHQKAGSPFMISNVGYGFRSPSPSGIVSLAAGSCNVDINCITGNHWQREKRSVVHMQIPFKDNYGKIKTQTCSGVLVNQTSDIKKPYILTAGHCVYDDDMAAGTVFSFGYEKIACNDLLSPPISKTIHGSTLIAYKHELDFALLELNTDIPDAYRPFYAGWNRSDNAPSSGIGIHHPRGDVKKISVENDPLETATFKDIGLVCDDNAHWWVKIWDVGTTEDGSSGSPLFDKNHLMVGTLTGGDARCTNPINDYYSKFNTQWNKYNLPEESLKTWLDPENTGTNLLYGYDPIASFEDECDTLSHIGNNEKKVVVPSDKWGVLTGHNNKTWTGFAEKFKNDTIAKIIGLEADIAEVYSKGSQVRFSIWTGDEFPTREVWALDTVISAEYRNYPMQMYLNRTVELTEDFFIGYSIGYAAIDTFALYQSVKRPYEGISALYVEEGGIWKPLSEETPPTYASLGIHAIGQFGKIKEEPGWNLSSQDLRVIFQPGNDVVFIYIENPQGSAVVECFDLSGRKMPVNELSRYFVMHNETLYLQVEISTGNLPYGMYIIRSKDQNKKQSGKFIRL
ncbi:MAG: trypsin-like peptidase domain-containing protein, partial [Bacteroidales bacterium]|nr:trypsin-like peptidase domain-containing protein [Bacteroidales bacterium]